MAHTAVVMKPGTMWTDVKIPTPHKDRLQREKREFHL